MIRAKCSDAYLLAVAVGQGGRFVSFDARISLDLVPQASAEQFVVRFQRIN